MNYLRHLLPASVCFALVSCGGGSTDTSKEPQYTWQIINLYQTSADALAKGCAILDASSLDSDQVIAARQASVGYKILFHNADGSVISQSTLSGSALPDNGKVIIDSSLVPDDGYVSLEEFAGSNSANQDIYLFSVHKSLLRDLTLNVRASQINADCYLGEQFLGHLPEEGTAVSVEETGSAYYQTSYANSATLGQQSSSHIPVAAPLSANLPVLVTAYENYTDSGATDLTHYAMVPASQIYDANDSASSPSLVWMNEVSETGISLSAMDLTLHATSQLALAYEDEIYQWQPMHQTNQNLSWPAEALAAQSWALQINGELPQSGWQLTYQQAFNGAPIDLIAPALTTFSAELDSSCGNSYCVVSQGYDSASFQIQRTQVRAYSTANRRDFYQSIYAPPGLAQPLMESSTQTLSMTGAEIEISLGQLNLSATDEVAEFLEHHLDIQNSVSQTLDNYQNWNGSLSLYSVRKSRQIRNFDTTIWLVENSSDTN